MMNYTIELMRDGKFWVITVPGLPGATQARNVGEIETMAVDFISIHTGVDHSEIRLKPHSLPA